MTRVFFVFLTTLIALLADSTFMQDQIKDIELFNTQKEIYEQQKQEQSHTSAASEIQPVPLLHVTGVQGPCIRIDQINTKGITLIPSRDLEKIFRPYLHKCNTIVQLNNLVTRINNWYMTKGYITSRAYLEAQDLSGGKLTISAMEGKIESVEGKGVFTRLVFLDPRDRHLNLRDLEVGIEQLNRLKSFQTRMDLIPSEKEGYSRVIMQADEHGFPVRGNMGVNNFGTVKSGKYQINGSLEFENFIGMNDVLTFGYNTTSRQDKENRSRGYSLSYGLPISRAYLTLKYSRFDYDQIVDGLNKTYNSSGNSKTYRLSLEQKLFHTKTQNGILNISFDRKRNDNYLAGVHLDTSSSVLSVLHTGYTHKIAGQTWDGYVTATYHRGFSILGAATAPGTSPVFSKWTLDLSYNKRFDLNSTYVSARYNLSVHAQVAHADILGSEHIGMGGPYSVRGFKSEGSLSGNIGAYARNELSLVYQTGLGSISPYAGLDFGAVKHNSASNGGRIMGAALGVRTNIKGFALDLFVTAPLYNSNVDEVSPVDGKTHNNGRKFFGMSLSYQF